MKLLPKKPAMPAALPMPAAAADVPKDACDLLDADHVAVKHLMVEYARLAAAAPLLDPRGERRAIAQRICKELTVHAQIEEEIFYPALQGAVPGEQLEEAREEHQGIKGLVARIQGMRNADPAMDELVAELAREVEHHVKEERDEIFPEAKAAESVDLVALGEQLKERQAQLQ